MSTKGNCNVCKKPIKESQPHVDIGNNLKRHKKCHPGIPKFMKERKSEILEKRHYIKKSDKIYDRNKEKRNFKKDLDNE